MTDTVQKLMELADDYADRVEFPEARQALEAELVRLFTPLSDEQITKALVKTYKGGHHAFAREIESCHGIGGCTEMKILTKE